MSAAALVCAAVQAQNFSVSPAYAATMEGNAATAAPFSNVNPFVPATSYRHQQIHDDTRGNGWLLQGISLRRDGWLPNFGSAVARTVDVEVRVGLGNYHTATTAFASNYLSAPTTVLSRRNVNLPDLTLNQGSPAPWSVVIPFNVPAPYAGRQDLVFDILTYSTTIGTQYILDAHSGLVHAAQRSLGKGCWFFAIPPTYMTLFAVQESTVDFIRYGWEAYDCPSNSPSLLLVGARNPNLTIPGLCTGGPFPPPNLYVDPLLVFPGVTSAVRSFTIPTARIPFDPALAGVRIYSQLISHDPSRTGVPFAASQGVESVLGDPPRPRIRQVWANDVSATVGVLGESSGGVVVRFAHQ